MRAANNIGSATGMTGSTPMMQQAQQNAQNISSGDMQNWLSQVLGINNQYGQGEAGLMGMDKMQRMQCQACIKTWVRMRVRWPTVVVPRKIMISGTC